MKKVFLSILILGLALRLYKINLSLLEFYPSRQVQTAEITKNLFSREASIITPTVTYFGPHPVPFLVEFPLYDYFVALLYRLNGSENEALGRVFSTAGWLISVFLLFEISNAVILSFNNRLLDIIQFF